MKRLAVCLVIALVGCTKRPQPAPLYPPDAPRYDWDFKDLETECDEPDVDCEEA